VTDVYIGSAKRTPIGQLNGTLSSLSALELGSAVISDLINDIDPSAFNEVIIG
jgi:acetyl-CoA C-acetyltransferase